MKSLSKAVAMASLLSAGVMGAQVANAEVSASVGIASAYLWRGQDLSASSDGVESNGAVPAFSGSLDYSNESGLYAGIWTSSGDFGSGTETDLYVGFAGEAGSIGYDISYATYLYTGEDDIDDVAEVIVGVSTDAFGAKVYIPTDSDADYTYITLGAGMGDYSFTLGANTGTDAGDYTHADVSYAYNEKLSFTYSQVLSEDTEDAIDSGGIFVVSYSLPIE
ncbi:hypothetical protein NBRC116188_21940 [Oceaniserpentilla sp. 4NH20-0058]|uniref:TorF family putative porin n=1 Tax=Oceaniserpentilla sp. 4NH20-0058 TaxID=3127660 RepID=UPI00310B5C9E